MWTTTAMAGEVLVRTAARYGFTIAVRAFELQKGQKKPPRPPKIVSPYNNCVASRVTGVRILGSEETQIPDAARRQRIGDGEWDMSDADSRDINPTPELILTENSRTERPCLIGQRFRTQVMLLLKRPPGARTKFGRAENWQKTCRKPEDLEGSFRVQRQNATFPEADRLKFRRPRWFHVNIENEPPEPRVDIGGPHCRVGLPSALLGYPTEVFLPVVWR
ncbi:hypothetical protein C8R47DRAFT_1080147 [Mycena vitilis]|nr:hypothetical protein C8R47DRAFT_1080147 [Mycena vitilis]